MTRTPTKAEVFTWIAKRASEPSTYAGIAAGALAVSDVAKDAQGVAAIFKEAGPVAGGIALFSAVAAIVKSDKHKADPDVIDGEFTVVKDKPE